MPVVSKDKSNPNPAKYILYYSTTFGGNYKRSYRAVVQSFRTQMKGLGAGSAAYLPQNQLNNDLKTEELTPNMFIKILDGTKFWDDEYTSVGDEVFIGTIESVTNDIFQGSTDRQGTIIFNEIGHYLSTVPIVWSQNKQIFNPVIGDKCYGNRDSENENEFEDDPDKMPTTDSDSKFATTQTDGRQFNDRVWSLEQMLTYMSSKFSFDIEFPWKKDQEEISRQESKDIDALNPEDEDYQDKVDIIKNKANNAREQVEKDYYLFKDSTSVRSYNNYDGMSIPQMLDELLQEPFSYYISYISTSAPTYVIVNKSPVAIEEVCPAAYSTVKNIDNSIIENLNITEDAEVYDRVTYRGDNVLFCGTITPWVANTAESLVPDWTTEEETKYAKGGDEVADDQTAAYSVRAELPNVYRKLKFKYFDEDCYLRLPKKVNEQTGEYTQAAFFTTENGTYDMVPFLPRVDFVKYENNSIYVLSKPTVYNSIGTHKTPSRLLFRWAEKLPFSTSEDSDALKDPFIIATTRTAQGSSVASNKLNFIDMSKSGIGYDTARIKFHRDGLSIDLAIPETLAYNNDILFLIGDTLYESAKVPWKNEYLSQRNPSSLENYRWFTSWEATAFTVAAYSEQRLEWTVDNPNSENIVKTKVIEDDSLQCHIVHAGTIKKLKDSPFEVGLGRSSINGFERFQKDTFIRNDFPKLHTLAKQTAQWLFQKKRALRLENHLAIYPTGSWNIGEMIKQIKDEKITHNINTVVESIEYDAITNRVRISTSIPSMPEFKRLRQQPISSANIAPVKDSKSPSIKESAKTITIPAQPIVGQITGGAGGGSATPASHIYTVIGGNIIEYLGDVGVKHITTEITTADPDWFVGAITGGSILPDGYGWARSIDDGEIVLLLNDSESLIQYDLVRQPVFGIATTVASEDDAEVTFPAVRVVGAI